MRFGILITACAIIGAAMSCVAQEDSEQRAERAIAAFEGWLAENGTSGALALVRNGVLVAEIGVGRDAGALMELASVSKSITGVCAVELVSQGVLAWSDRLADGVDSDLDFTLGQLVTHQSGLAEDSTQVAMQGWLDIRGGHKGAQVLKLVKKRGGATGPAGTFLYNNENFALAGLLIEEASGRAYEDICHDVAISHAGVVAKASSRSAAFLPWGGWQMRPRDLAVWHAYWFAGGSDIARSPKDLPHVKTDAGLFYGPGTVFRTLTPGNIFWHFGSLCFPRRLNVGSYAATAFGEWTVVAAWDACLDWRAMAQVDQRVMGALFGGL